MDGLSDYNYSRQNNIIKFIHYAEYIVYMYLVYKCIVQGFSKSAFKGPNLNFHQCQGPDRNNWLLQNLFLINTAAYITFITNKHTFLAKK